MGVQIDDEILAKSGEELFKELLRVYSVAEVDDYFKNGQWKDEVMRTDIHLIYQHAREAGADDPIPLEEVKVPDLPRAAAIGGYQVPAGVGGLRPVAPVGVAARGVRPPPAVASAGAGAASPGGTVAELRLFALFATKWKLDPTRTKMMLAKLTPARRRFVILSFKTTAAGVEATNALQMFITKSETTNAGGLAAAATPGLRPAAGYNGAVRPVTVAPAQGVKRPPSPAMLAAAMQANKRPAMAPRAFPGIRPAVAGRPMVRPALGLRPAVVAPRAGGGGLIQGLLQRF